MRIAIFSSRDETIILQVKGTKKDFSSIDGIKEYFGPGIRDLSEFQVLLAHIGSGQGVVVQSEISVDTHGRTQDIGDWFLSNEYGELTLE